ncbi:MAG: hypothetical protein JNM91_00575, partial [Flavobacteriales bacterium]|nr:hypothetical protein [Flavobacteriales bacterium]
MSTKRWVDGLFRERLEHREFPVQDGEFDAMRTLLEARNAARTSGVGGKVSAWWLTSLLPVAAVLWWSNVPNEQGVSGRTVEEKLADGPVANTASTAASYSLTGIAEALDVMTSGEVNAQRSVPGKSSSAPVMNDAVSDSSVSPMQRVVQDGKSGATRSFTPPGSASFRAPDHGLAYAGGSEGGLSIANASPRETIGLLGTRWSLIAEPLVAMPVNREQESPKRRSSGELHVFGAPLGVKTARGGGSGGTMRSGSLYGLEYRVRSKYVSLATGIHYGTYGMQAGEGAAEVKLNYVEVPLLAGVEVGFKRFGALVHGGMSLDFLFDSGGRYPMEGARSG